jgi:hypothetical protein
VRECADTVCGEAGAWLAHLGVWGAALRCKICEGECEDFLPGNGCGRGMCLIFVLGQRSSGAGAVYMGLTQAELVQMFACP